MRDAMITNLGVSTGAATTHGRNGHKTERMGKPGHRMCIKSDVERHERPLTSRVDGNCLDMNGPRRDITETFRREVPYRPQ